MSLARFRPIWAMVWTRLYSAVRTAEKVCSRSGGTSAQVVPVGRLGGKAQVDPARVNLLQGLLDGRLIHLDRLPAHVETLPC